jgi:hypothetical protein
MAKFEVHIPASEPGGFNLTLKVGADNWMAALKAGMQKLGEQGAISQNVMVDIQEDNSIHVTEAASGRVFRIRELSAEEVQKAQVKRPSQIITAPPARAPEPPARTEAKTEPGLKAVAPPPPAPAGAKTLVGAPAPEAFDKDKTLLGRDEPPPRAQAAPPRSSPSSIQRGRVEVTDVEELEQPVNPIVGAIGRPKSVLPAGKSQRQLAEDLLGELFLRVVEIDALTSPEAAAKFVLDLALEKIPCEAGSVLRSDGATGDLTFLQAHGPKANDLMNGKIVVPAGSGIAGFCAAEGVSVAVSDVEKDPRFYAAVGARVGFQTRSMLCSPMMTHGRSFGCVQLINRKGGPQFQEYEVGVLSYLAHQAALFLNSRI